MAQAKLVGCKKVANGIEVTFVDLNGNEFSDIYNGKLTIEDIKKLKGTHISFSDKENGIEFNRAWDGKKPVFSKEPYAGDDRADR